MSDLLTTAALHFYPHPLTSKISYFKGYKKASFWYSIDVNIILTSISVHVFPTYSQLILNNIDNTILNKILNNRPQIC